MQPNTGILLVNLGTPASPKPSDVYRYLIEFLTDERVIDMPWLKRQLLVRGVIVPSRYKQSASQYQQIWTKEGSPLMIYGKKVQEALQASLGKQFSVELAMRYQQPSIKSSLDKLLEAGIDHLIVLPLFPQYASATTGSVHQRVQEELCKLNVIPKVTLIDHFATHPSLIAAFCEVARKYALESYDHILFSFHGLPQRHIQKADRYGKCLASPDCCKALGRQNGCCYSAQCYATAQAIAKGLQLLPERYSVSFQSRLGKDPWLTPYTSEMIENLAREGKQKVLVMCPAFVCDCLETIFEIGVEGAHAFKQAGGKQLDLVPGLNDHPLWINALKAITLQHVFQRKVTEVY